MARRDRSDEEVEQNFASAGQGRATELQNRVAQGVGLRTDYNNRFTFSADVFEDTAAMYEAERERWLGTNLPEYEGKIAEARETARRVLEEEVIYRLREQLRQVERQFAELNRALDGLDFSGRTYRFTARVRDGYRPFYRMVMEAGKVEDRPLLDAAWHEEFASGPLAELVESILGERGSRGIDELRERADYRQYFDYDIEITDAEGGKSLFSRAAGSGSGGETQTPYYVAMLASMARLYRTREQGGSRAALVAFDEPFQKMDEYNIATTLRFAERLGLQLILASPKERAGQILPALGRATCLLVLRDGNAVFVEPFELDRSAAGADEPREAAGRGVPQGA